MNTRVDFDHLYRVKDPFNNRFFRGRVRFPHHLDRNALLTGESEVTAALTVGHAEGRTLADIVWTDNVAVVLISERLAAAFRAASFSGWSAYPVRVEAEGAKDQHVGLTITGRCGPLDYTRGEWVRKDDEPGRLLRGLFFDERSWDRSDFFLPAGTLNMLVTERVRDCLQREKIKNVRCERLSDVLTAEVVLRHTPGARVRW
jgi:hypothetical protein